MREASGRSCLRGIGLGGRQVGGMNIHVRRGVIHAAEGRWSRIVAVTHGIGRQAVLSRSTGEITSRRRRPGVVVESGRGPGQTGARTGIARPGNSSGRVRIAGSIGSGEGRLGGRRQAECRELITREQRPFRSVMVVPRNFSRTSGVDLRDRR